MSASAVLHAQGLEKRFGARVALRAVSFALRSGELVGIVGPNGAGKTTLLSLLAGALAPDAGTVSLDGAGGVGWVPQVPALYGALSVAENLRLFARLERVADIEGTVERMLVQTDLVERAREPVARLSGGNRQRVNIAIGLLSAPAVLLLDEPSAALDPRQRARLWEFIAGLLASGTTILFSTHDISEVERFADRVLLLADGELLFTGTPAELDAAVRVGGAPDPGGTGTGGADTGVSRTATGGPGGSGDLEQALLAFLAARGHG